LGDMETEQILSVWLRHWLLWLVYFLMLFSGSVLMILWRSHKTMVYNVDVEQFANALARTLAQVGVTGTMTKQRMVLTPTLASAGSESTAITTSAPKPTPNARYAELMVEGFSALCH